MKVLVIGANGRVGEQLVHQLLEKGHVVYGTSRHDELISSDPKYFQLNLDLSNAVDQLTDQIPDEIEAFYFVAGSRGKNLLQVDLHGAVKTMKLAETKSVSRYIMLSAFYSLEPELWRKETIGELTDYYIAKHYADVFLTTQTNLNYTILQPAALIEKPGTGKISVNDPSGSMKNSIEDVAATLVEILENELTYKKVIPMHEGDTLIAEAFKSL